MINLNLKAFGFLILGVFITTFVGSYFVKGQPTGLLDLVVLAFSIIGINVIIWGFFIKWFWKLPIFRSWLVPFPNLSGKWEGEIKTNYEGKDLEIPAEVLIKQTFFNIQVTMKTGESESNSVNAGFDIDKDRGLENLFYSYQNVPSASVRDRSEIHYGTTRLSFKGFKVDTMEGEYWTSRKSTGDLLLVRSVKNTG